MNLGWSSIGCSIVISISFDVVINIFATTLRGSARQVMLTCQTIQHHNYHIYREWMCVCVCERGAEEAKYFYIKILFHIRRSYVVKLSSWGQCSQQWDRNHLDSFHEISRFFVFLRKNAKWRTALFLEVAGNCSAFSPLNGEKSNKYYQILNRKSNGDRLTCFSISLPLSPRKCMRKIWIATFSFLFVAFTWNQFDNIFLVLSAIAPWPVWLCEQSKIVLFLGRERVSERSHTRLSQYTMVMLVISLLLCLGFCAYFILIFVSSVAGAGAGWIRQILPVR